MTNEFNGFIQLHRSLMAWEWYDDIPTKVLFLHLLLMANHTDKKWRGKTIQRGQHMTSIPKLAEGTGLTIKQVRRALDNLKTTGEVTTSRADKGTLVTVENYSVYQGGSKSQGRQKADKGQIEGRRRATNNNDNNDNNDNNTPQTPQGGRGGRRNQNEVYALLEEELQREQSRDN